MPSLQIQVISLAGAIFILVAYVGHQAKWMLPHSRWYNLLNAIGGGLLAYAAFHPFQIGFVIMEVAWFFVSLLALARSFRPATILSESQDPADREPL